MTFFQGHQVTETGHEWLTISRENDNQYNKSSHHSFLQPPQHPLQPIKNQENMTSCVQEKLPESSRFFQKTMEKFIAITNIYGLNRDSPDFYDNIKNRIEQYNVRRF